MFMHTIHAMLYVIQFHYLFKKVIYEPQLNLDSRSILISYYHSVVKLERHCRSKVAPELWDNGPGDRCENACVAAYIFLNHFNL